MRADARPERAASPERQDGHPGFETLVQDTVAAFAEIDPILASWSGLHGPWDGRLPDRSEAAAARNMAMLRALLVRFEAAESDGLPSREKTEAVLARGFLAARLALVDRRPCHRLMPQLFVRDIVFGVYPHLERSWGSIETRAEAVAARLSAVPAHLESARCTLTEPSAAFTESAVLQAQGAEHLLRMAMPSFLAEVSSPALRARCEAAVVGALRAVDAFSEFLLGSLMPRSRGEFRIGKAVFNRLLRDWHRIPFDADDLVVVGEKVYHETLREIRATAGRIRPRYNWSRLLGELSDDHPPCEDLVDCYAQAVSAARSFVAERKLADLDGDVPLQVTPTPHFARPFYPCAGYVAPGSSENGRHGVLWITRLDPGDAPERRLQCLRGHSRHAIPVLVVHKGYPGHHLQAVRAQAAARPLRVLFGTPVLTEGWALYCEEMMWREGFLGDDRVHLMQLRDQLWRACRVIVDVCLHTGKMSFNDAVSFLVRKAKLPRLAAMAEVRRYCERPTQPMGYIVGKLLISELLEDAKAEKGDAFSLPAFHNAVLSCGSVPVELVRRDLAVPRRADEKEVLRALTRAPRPTDDSAPPKPRRKRVSGRSRTAP